MSATSDNSVNSSTSDTFDPRRLARVILPKRGEPRDVRSLYIVEDESAPGRVTALSRTSASIPAGTEVSFETYFNAFPASYWRRWSQLGEVQLRIELTGDARIDIYRSKIDGSRIAVTGGVVETDDSGRGTAEFTVSLAPFEDGGWIWFDLTCESETTVHAAGWYATVDAGEQTLVADAVVTDPGTGEKTTLHAGDTLPAREPRITIGIPTFNRPADAVAALEALSSDPVVDSVVDALIMPDQGTKHPADEPGFAAVEAFYGERLRMPVQGNLGGSGGYSRIMYEARHPERGTDSPFILYMDDDIAIEPDSVLRALAAARYASSPMLIGGQMLNLQERSHLHTMGEIIDRGSFMWTGAPHTHYDHDFYRHPLSDRGEYGVTPSGERIDSKDLHRRIDADYNGWWMCMIPRVVADTIGQPLPLFIKWDDGEYGLRARDHGFPTASWPGIAIWHMAWSDKDDAIDWQAYFHLRNRLIVAALQHEGSPNGIIASMAKATTKHLMCLEYSTVAIQNEAMKDFLAGPDHLFEILGTALPRISALRKNFPDAVVVPSASQLPPADGGPARLTEIPLTPLKKITTLVKVLRNNLRPADPHHHEVPQVNLPPIEARWFSMGRVDGATVTTADGRGVVFRKRDRDKAKELATESVRLQKEVLTRFDEMRQRYRVALPELTSTEAWGRIFEPESVGE
ncbi:Galactofuranosyltransferase GlfT2 [Corynebacterium provencense]|jgi:galactofuranosylgalactofuranosylrhamnosyl-N-acetylglucosaminyl-diphospho-decaprenol beta-1,5/1,6-galactofuranosyltransferase|uniref:Galactofuranosyltransferase GlfT2 n=1 Tax=Corynebacterium provencense TaxID=1737425 RepID=A0A2Z3YXJ1_9CORY|nr:MULTISPECIES: glycosyltransferase [Corynebacterium]AWT27254.1 Galactofuranosyltransferase GlfT2 [Corynebacterium provencense]MCI1255395.1 glycosyltransferase [Corynebacterium provencense]